MVSISISFALGLILGFVLFKYRPERSRSVKKRFYGVLATSPAGASNFATSREAAIAWTSVGQVVWISATPLMHSRVYNVRSGATVEEALTFIEKVARLSPTVVIIDGLDGLEAAGSRESPTAVVDELKTLSPSPVHIFLPEVL